MPWTEAEAPQAQDLSDPVSEAVQIGLARGPRGGEKQIKAALNEAKALLAQARKDKAFKSSLPRALQLVRDRASLQLPIVTAATRDEFREAVKHERRIELAFEDHRYWDLLRWKDAMEVLNKPVRGVKITKTGEGKWSYTQTEVATRTFLERNYYMPFTRSEVENSNHTLEQNPGY